RRHPGVRGDPTGPVPPRPTRRGRGLGRAVATSRAIPLPDPTFGAGLDRLAGDDPVVADRLEGPATSVSPGDPAGVGLRSGLGRMRHRRAARRGPPRCVPGGGDAGLPLMWE